MLSFFVCFYSKNPKFNSSTEVSGIFHQGYVSLIIISVTICCSSLSLYRSRQNTPKTIKVEARTLRVSFRVALLLGSARQLSIFANLSNCSSTPKSPKHQDPKLLPTSSNTISRKSAISPISPIKASAHPRISHLQLFEYTKKSETLGSKIAQNEKECANSWRALLSKSATRKRWFFIQTYTLVILGVFSTGYWREGLPQDL